MQSLRSLPQQCAAVHWRSDWAALRAQSAQQPWQCSARRRCASAAKRSEEAEDAAFQRHTVRLVSAFADLAQNAVQDGLWIALLLCLAHAKGKDIMAGAVIDQHTLVAVVVSVAAMGLAGGIVLLPNWGPPPAVATAWQIPVTPPPKAGDEQVTSASDWFAQPVQSDQQQATEALQALQKADDTGDAAARVLGKLEAEAQTSDFERFCDALSDSKPAPVLPMMPRLQINRTRRASRKRKDSLTMQLYFEALLLVLNTHCLSAAIHATNRHTRAQQQTLRMGPPSQTMAVLREHVDAAEPTAATPAAGASRDATAPLAAAAQGPKPQTAMATTIAALEALGIGSVAKPAEAARPQRHAKHHTDGAGDAGSVLDKLERIAQGQSAHGDDADSAVAAGAAPADWRDPVLAARLQYSREAVERIEEQLRRRLDEAEESVERDIMCISRLLGEDITAMEAHMVQEMLKEGYVEEALDSFGPIEPVILPLEAQAAGLAYDVAPATWPQQFAACQYVVRKYAREACSPLMGLEDWGVRRVGNVLVIFVLMDLACDIVEWCVRKLALVDQVDMAFDTNIDAAGFARCIVLVLATISPLSSSLFAAGFETSRNRLFAWRAARSPSPLDALPGTATGLAARDAWRRALSTLEARAFCNRLSRELSTACHQMFTRLQQLEACAEGLYRFFLLSLLTLDRS